MNLLKLSMEFIYDSYDQLLIIIFFYEDKYVLRNDLIQL